MLNKFKQEKMLIEKLGFLSDKEKKTNFGI